MTVETAAVGQKRQRVVELRIPSELGWERAAMDVAATVARRMGFPADRIEDIKTAVAEATVNAIEHGNGLDLSRTVLIELIPEGGQLLIDVHDHSSKPFSLGGDPGKRPDLDAKLAGTSDHRGWGTFLIRSLMDEVEFTSTKQGNVVRMIVYLEP